MATTAKPQLYTEQTGRYDISCWTEWENGVRGILVQVLDLQPRSPETECRTVIVDFWGYGRKAIVRSDHSTHTVLRASSGWACDCMAAAAGRMCYHRRAVAAAYRYCEAMRAERRRTPASTLYPAPAALRPSA